jgi:hypothetical protein
MFLQGLSWPGERTDGPKKAPMKKTMVTKEQQPKPFTPGLTKAEVREHAYKMFRDKLPGHILTLDDWVTAERDLVKMREEAGESA